jgi:hypothetical protein
MALSTHANRHVELTADGDGPERSHILSDFNPEILFDLPFEEHEGKRPEIGAYGDFVNNSNLTPWFSPHMPTDACS